MMEAGSACRVVRWCVAQCAADDESDAEPCTAAGYYLHVAGSPPGPRSALSARHRDIVTDLHVSGPGRLICVLPPANGRRRVRRPRALAFDPVSKCALVAAEAPARR